MAATASANRPPPAHPGPNVGNLPSYSGLPNAGQQHPGLNGTSQDPGPPFHPQHHVSTQPVFYVPAPPPAPFLQYQWPVPFPYNPFAGFPGMGECCGIFFYYYLEKCNWILKVESSFTNYWAAGVKEQELF